MSNYEQIKALTPYEKGQLKQFINRLLNKILEKQCRHLQEK